MSSFDVPARDQVNAANQQVFDAIEKGLGFVPNLYATLAYSPSALPDYLALQNRKSSLRAREREVVNLVVSEVNACRYCLSAHTVLGKAAGLTDEQLLEVRGGTAAFDSKLDALARFTRAVAESRGHPEAATVDAFLAAGYTRENLVDVVMVIGDKTVTNYLHGITQVPIDFPLAPELPEPATSAAG